MPYFLDEHFHLKGIVSRRRPLDFHFHLKGKVTRRRPLDFHFQLIGKVHRLEKVQLNHFNLKGKIRQPGYFDTIFTAPISGSPVVPNRAELDTNTAVRVYLQVPEYGSDRLIGYARVNEIGFDWGLNQELLWHMKLLDFDREIFRSGSDYYGLLTTDGMYDYDKSTRKFIKLVIRAYVGSKKVDLTLPRLVIKECPASDKILSFSGYDYITEVLSQEINLPSFCAMEALGRVDSTHYAITNLTNTSALQELYVNYSLTKDYSYNSGTGVVTFPTAINEKYVVMARNPISKQAAIKSVCDQAVNKLPTVVAKEYINCDFRFNDQVFDCELATFGTTPRETVKKLINSIPGDYLIKPVGNTLKLVFMPKMLGDEYPSPKFYFPETLFKGKPSISKSSVRAFNFGNIKKPSRVYEAAEAVTV